MNFEEAKRKAEIEANKVEKIVMRIQENNDYWFFEAGLPNERFFDDGAGSVYINKKDGTVIPMYLWTQEIQELNDKFKEKSKTMYDYYDEQSKDKIVIPDSLKEYVYIENVDDKKENNNKDISEFDEEKNVEQIIISDLEFGNITINTITGEINCNNMKHDKKRLYNDFSIEYSMNKIEINDLKHCNLEECKNLFVDNLHLIFGIRNEIEEKVIQEIWNWFSVDFTPETLKQQFIKLRINVTIYLYDGEYINLGTSWVFEEEYSDINSGYADFNVDINSKNIECTDIGFF